MGLFTSKSDLFKWQQLLMPGTNRLVMNKKQLQEESQRQAADILKIIQDCVNLVNKTKKPDVFFKRYDTLKNKAYKLTLFEPYVKFSGLSPTESLKKIEKEEQDSIHDFINRYYDSVCVKVNKLKTENAKLNHIQEFHDELEAHFGVMNQKNINYVNDLYETAFNTIFEEYNFN